MLIASMFRGCTKPTRIPYTYGIRSSARLLRSVVLASASPRRLELLMSLGLAVRQVPSYDLEIDPPGLAPRELSAHHACAKARVVAAAYPDDVVIAGDTVVDLDGRSLGKPRDSAHAREMLAELSGRDHLVHTSFVVCAGPSCARVSRTETTRVTFSLLSAGMIEAYVATGDAMDKAGAYGIQGRGAALVERIDGDFYTVMGFPLGSFLRTLPELGLTLAEESR